MKNLIIRTITGIVFAAVTLASVNFHPLASALLFLVFAVAAYIELASLVNRDVNRISVAPGLVTGIASYLIVALIAFGMTPGYVIFILIPIFFFIPGYEILRHREPTLNYTLAAWAAVIYTFIPFAITNFIIEPVYPGFHHGPMMLLAVLVIIWANDVFAYLGGKLYGKRKLAPIISPSKTWEGTFTGITASLAVGYIFSLFSAQLSVAGWIGLAFVIAIAGIFGDLGESRLKRTVSVKDSGNILPGHGGVLDRFDAFIFAVPAAFIYIQIFGA